MGYQDQNEQTTDKLKQFETEINNLKIEIENVSKLNTQYMEQNSSLKTKMDTKDQQINELTTDRNEWENKYESEHNQFLDRLQQINKLNSEISNYKHQIELLQSNKDSNAGKLFEDNKTMRNVFGDSTGDLLLGSSDSNVAALQADKSY